MARIRSVKPALRTSRVVASWPFEVRYFWVLLWGYLDDKGRGLDLPRAIAADCFPLDDISAGKVDRWLTLIASTKLGTKPPPLCRYEVDGDRYIHALNFHEHQKPNRPTPSTLPPCPLHDGLTAPLTESPLSPHVLEEEGEVGDRRGEGESLSGPPPPWCSKHPGGTDTPCRGCQRAREATEAWHADQRARVDSAPRCDRHPTELANPCRTCRSEQLAPNAA